MWSFDCGMTGLPYTIFSDAAAASCACAAAVTTRTLLLQNNMAMKALRGMVNGAMSELSSAVSGTRPPAAAPTSAAAASREHAMAVKRDYISQPRLSESPSGHLR